MSNFILILLASGLYAVAAIRLLVNLRGAGANAVSSTINGDDRQARQVSLLVATAALLLHAWVAYAKTGLPESLALPFFTALLVTAAAVVLVQLLMCISLPADYLGVAVYPVAALVLLGSLLHKPAAATIPDSIQVHVLLSITAYAVLALAAAQAILVAIQRHFLNEHKPGGFMRRLPPLISTESLLFTLLAAGFGLLSLSLASGFFYLEDMFAQHLVHKTVLSTLAWCIFAILLFGRWRFGWRGRTAVHWTLAGFAVLLVAYFGSKLVLELILART